MIELRGISKYFPSNGVTALENAWLTLRAGEIHALLGENGTGKSTLMHILCGYLNPSSGSILVDGKEQKFSAPADALALGIGMVRQHPGFIQSFKVWEDCILGAEKPAPKQGSRRAVRQGDTVQKGRSFFLDPGLSRKRVMDLSSRWDFDLPLDKPADSLTVSQRQKAAVLALLLRDVKWFIFDEPTAILSPEETKNLFRLFRRLRSDGKGIILITHKLEEALENSDRITVIRRGVTAETQNTGDLSIDALENSIFGAAEISVTQDKAVPSGNLVSSGTAVPSGKEKPVLAIRDLLIEMPALPLIRNINLELLPGKILGISGARDSGLETLELAVSGLLELHGSRGGRLEGSITLNGREIAGKGVRAFREAGGAYLGADRLGINLAPDFPIRESLIIHAFRRARRGFGIFLDMEYLDTWCRKIMNRAGIARPVSDTASSFSGGMLQRILLAREFAEDASLMILAEAGSGLDQFNRTKLSKELKAQVRRGMHVPAAAFPAALLFSTDMDELNSVADEIMIFRNGTLVEWGNNEI